MWSIKITQRPYHNLVNVQAGIVLEAVGKHMRESPKPALVERAPRSLERLREECGVPSLCANPGDKISAVQPGPSSRIFGHGYKVVLALSEQRAYERRDDCGDLLADDAARFVPDVGG